MKIDLKPGKYIVAVSGGIDSMVLLDLASKLKGVELVVAHFDHGIHRYSADYCKFVAMSAKNKGLEFASERVELGPNASEAVAREARYKFLYRVKRQYKAEAILTAHHQDDLLETILINLIRGTGRKGLISLGSSEDRVRPLLNYSKEEITKYAKEHAIEWREDPSNLDEKYLRNYLRHSILSKMKSKDRKKLLNIAGENRDRDKKIQSIINDITKQNDVLDRKIFNRLDHNSSKEVLTSFLRQHTIAFDSKMIEKCVNFIKTAARNKKFTVSDNYYLEISEDRIKLVRR